MHKPEWEKKVRDIKERRKKAEKAEHDRAAVVAKAVRDGRAQGRSVGQEEGRAENEAKAVEAQGRALAALQAGVKAELRHNAAVAAATLALAEVEARAQSATQGEEWHRVAAAAAEARAQVAEARHTEAVQHSVQLGNDKRLAKEATSRAERALEEAEEVAAFRAKEAASRAAAAMEEAEEVAAAGLEEAASRAVQAQEEAEEALKRCEQDHEREWARVSMEQQEFELDELELLEQTRQRADGFGHELTRVRRLANDKLREEHLKGVDLVPSPPPVRPPCARAPGTPRGQTNPTPSGKAAEGVALDGGCHAAGAGRRHWRQQGVDDGAPREGAARNASAHARGLACLERDGVPARGPVGQASRAARVARLGPDRRAGRRQALAAKNKVRPPPFHTCASHRI
jgi:hypothetical protein